MQNVIRKIFSGKFDDEVHSDFVKFSKGEFKNKYLIESKKQKDKWSIKTGSEFANFLVRKCLEGVNGSVNVKGVIVSTFNLRGEKEYLFNQGEKIKQFMGIKQLEVNSELNSEQIIGVMDQHPKAFFALSFKTDKHELKIKAKAPKSAKPSNKGNGEVSADFCSLKTNDEKIVEDLFFDFNKFTQIIVNHTLKINKIELPTDVEDPKEIREKSKRIGTVVRRVVVDGKEFIEERKFEA